MSTHMDAIIADYAKQPFVDITQNIEIKLENFKGR